jgi:hypothetical protein
MIKRTILILLILSASYKLVIAQDFPYGSVSPQELDMNKYAKDTSAHAVVLQEYGSSRIVVSNDNRIKLIFEYHVKIKIFDSKGFDNATVGIILRNDEKNESSDDLYTTAGITYYKDENGVTQQVTLDNKKIYNTRDYKYQSTSKFTMPGLRNGCVIEYKYALETPFFYNKFRPWEFQGRIPKIYSEYEVHIPGHYNYNASIRGPLKLSKNKGQIETACFSTQGAKSDCSDIQYGMKDIPAFVAEDFMTSPQNFLSAINFELVEYTDPLRGTLIKVANNWKDIDYQLKTGLYFGVELKKKDLLKEHIAPLITDKATNLEKTKAIYADLQKWFKWNGFVGIYTDGIKKALGSHSGSIADINLALSAALNSAGISSEVVLLSTRDHGVVNDIFPAINDFNYVVAKANIDGKSYLLDASDNYLAFGMLPLICLNDKGRVFSLDKPSYWMDLNLPQKESTTRAFDFTLQDDGKIKGTITEYSIGYAAYLKRRAIKKFNSINEYVEFLDGRWTKMKILKSDISNLDSLNLPITERYEVEINLYNQLNRNQVSFNPFFLDRMTANPFKLAERSYPVDWGMPSEQRFVLTMHLPPQYIIASPPETISMGLPDKGGRFITVYEPQENSFMFSHIIAFNKSVYNSNEYPYLKELYNKIIQSEKAEMVFRKK